MKVYTKRCSNCGTRYEEELNRCPECESKKTYNSQFFSGSTINDMGSNIMLFFKAIAVIAFIIGIIALFVYAFSGSGNNKPTEDEITNWRTCSEKTNTYYKCSWSHSENRCTCKQR